MTKIPGGSFVLPSDVVKVLGHGDRDLGTVVLYNMFAGGRYSMAAPDVVPPEVVTDLGHGDLQKGKRVLQKFVTLTGEAAGRSHDEKLVTTPSPMTKN